MPSLNGASQVEMLQDPKFLEEVLDQPEAVIISYDKLLIRVALRETMAAMPDVLYAAPDGLYMSAEPLPAVFTKLEDDTSMEM